MKVPLDNINDKNSIVDVFGWSVEYGPELIQPTVISQYDVVIVAMKYIELADELCEIIKSVANDGKIIINFYRIYEAGIPLMRADKVMKNPNIKEYEGMILGISHAEVGILSDRLDIPVCNLAVSAQDLFYNKKTLEYVIQNYKHKIPNLKRLIIDMFDYNYFNIDTSLGNVIYDYFGWGGYNLDEHHLKENKGYVTSAEQYIDYLNWERFKNIKEEQLNVWEQLFPTVYRVDSYDYFYNLKEMDTRLKVLTDKQVSDYKLNSKVINIEFKETIEENIVHLEQLLELAFATWKDIKVTLILCPLPKGVKEYRKEIYGGWKKMFEDEMEKIQNKFDVDYLSYLEDTTFDDNIYYYDAEHLNYYGALKFTERINRDIIHKI